MNCKTLFRIYVTVENVTSEVYIKCFNFIDLRILYQREVMGDAEFTSFYQLGNFNA